MLMTDSNKQEAGVKTRMYSLHIEMDSDDLADLIEMTMAINTTPHDIAEMFFMDIMGYGDDDERSRMAKEWFKTAIKGRHPE